MKTFWLWLTPEQPLQLADDLDHANSATARSIRGMLTAAALRTCVPGALHGDGPCGSDCLYWSLFGPHSGLQLSSAHAVPLHDPAERLPITASTCRDHPGFLPESGHGVLDLALRIWSAEAADRLDHANFAPSELVCAVCGAPLVSYPKLITRQSERTYQTVVSTVSPRLTVHRPLSRSRLAPATLFTQQGTILPEGWALCANLAFPDTLETPLRTILFRELYLGGRRTRGMGRVRAELTPRPDQTQTLRARIAELNRAIRTERRFYAAMHGDQSAEDDGTWFFTLDFPDGVLFDPANRADILAGVGALHGVQTVRRWTTVETLSGWNMAARLPARNQNALFGVILCSVPSEGDRAQIEQTLVYLEAHGLNAGREAGLGRVSVCAPFHLQMEPA